MNKRDLERSPFFDKNFYVVENGNKCKNQEKGFYE